MSHSILEKGLESLVGGVVGSNWQTAVVQYSVNTVGGRVTWPAANIPLNTWTTIPINDELEDPWSIVNVWGVDGNFDLVAGSYIMMIPPVTTDNGYQTIGCFQITDTAGNPINNCAVSKHDYLGDSDIYQTVNFGSKICFTNPTYNTCRLRMIITNNSCQLRTNRSAIAVPNGTRNPLMVMFIIRVG